IVVFAVIRNETEMPFRNLLVNTLGIAGALMIAFSAFWGFKRNDFMPGEGTVILILGILYVSAYIGQETNTERSCRASLGLGFLGALGFVASLVSSLFPEGTFLPPYNTFFTPSGLTIMGMSILCMAISIGICCDWPVVLIARRELAAYFYSP